MRTETRSWILINRDDQAQVSLPTGQHKQTATVQCPSDLVRWVRARTQCAGGPGLRDCEDGKVY